LPAVPLCLGLGARVAPAFTLNGASAMNGWNTSELVFHLNPANCPGSTEAMIDDALAMWNGVPTAAITLSRGETTDSIATVAAGLSADVPAIFCLNDATFTADPDSIPGFATGSHVSSDQHVDYGYLVLNVRPDGRASIERLDDQLVKVVVAHEVGHVLGLGHSANKGALMYYDATAKTTASLAQDDVDGLTYLYPRDEAGRDKMLGCGVAGGPAAHGAAGALAALLLAPCLLAARRGRRRPNAG
jgi:hypothetical protein